MSGEIGMKCLKCGKFYYFPLLHLHDEHGISEYELLKNSDKWLRQLQEWTEKTPLNLAIWKDIWINFLRDYFEEVKGK
jgi:hypothetical protein